MNYLDMTLADQINKSSQKKRIAKGKRNELIIELTLYGVSMALGIIAIAYINGKIYGWW